MGTLKSTQILSHTPPPQDIQHQTTAPIPDSRPTTLSANINVPPTNQPASSAIQLHQYRSPPTTQRQAHSSHRHHTATAPPSDNQSRQPTHHQRQTTDTPVTTITNQPLAQSPINHHQPALTISTSATSHHKPPQANPQEYQQNQQPQCQRPYTRHHFT